jgi:hypothetical protein
VAFDRVDAFDPILETFDDPPAAPLNHGRHGTEAIVSGSSVIITAGSPLSGAGSQTKMEAYGLYAPSGIASTPGVLAASGSNNRTVHVDRPTDVVLAHVSGNTGVIVQDIALVGIDAPCFTLTAAPAMPFLIGTGESIELRVTCTGSCETPVVAELVVTYSGGGTASWTLEGAGSTTQRPTHAPVSKQPTQMPTSSPSNALLSQPTQIQGCRPIRHRCSSQAQCCGGACDGLTRSIRTCRRCRKLTRPCVRTSQCCSGLKCRYGVCASLKA